MKELIEAFEKAGIKGTTTYLTSEQITKMEEIHKEVEEFLKKVDEQHKESEEYLKNHPMIFKSSPCGRMTNAPICKIGL